MTEVSSYRLDGLEPDNLLAFLALLGLLRALETDDRKRSNTERLYPRAAWEIDTPPLRPRLFLVLDVSKEEVTERAAAGLAALTAVYAFDGQKDLNYCQAVCRALLEGEAKAASMDGREGVDLLASLMSDAAVKNEKNKVIAPTPLCLLFGQGHQHFLERLARIPQEVAPPPRGKGKKAVRLSENECLAEALFQSWHRNDLTFSFRWDPKEDVRYALMAGDPTDVAYKTGTQHGANRLAAVGLSVLTVVPETQAGRVYPGVVGGTAGAGGFSFAWPIWREPATLCAIRALMAHPDLYKPSGLKHLDVDHVLVARRISVGKFMNFSRARPLQPND